jgi:hypothetical protein
MPWYLWVGSYLLVGALFGVAVEAYWRLQTLREGNEYERWLYIGPCLVFWPLMLLVATVAAFVKGVIRVATNPAKWLDHKLDSWAARKAAPDLIRDELTQSKRSS